MIYLYKTDSRLIAVDYNSLKKWKAEAKTWTWFFSDYIYPDYESIVLAKRGKLRHICLFGLSLGLFKEHRSK